MKTLRKTTPMLLADNEALKVFRIQITMSNDRRVIMEFNDRRLAQMEYNRIRNLGIYIDTWVESIEYVESAE
jgi:hypothetical protein